MPTNNERTYLSTNNERTYLSTNNERTYLSSNNERTFSRFAQRVSLIKNRATVNEDLDPSLVIKRLKAEILTLREEVGFLKVLNII